jgi:carbon-monoxide dehydrogenase medium subunit
MWKKYLTPKSLDEAVSLLAEFNTQTRIIAGATDLMLELERGIRSGVDTLVDITRIPDLDRISLDDQGWIHLGPLVTHNHCVASPLILERAFALAQACWEVGSPQIRNRGTIVGNVVTASPANDSIPVLATMDAKVHLRSKREERIIALEDFHLGVRKTVMQSDELVTGISFQPLDEGGRSCFEKLALRKAQAISVVNAAVTIQITGGQITKAAIALGSVAPTIVRAQEAEEFLLGKEPTTEVIQQASEVAVKAASSIDDLRGSKGYRNLMVRTCTLKALRKLVNGQERAGFPVEPIMLRERESWQLARSLPESVMHEGDSVIETKINGRTYRFQSGQGKSLLRLLREEAGLIGTKEGCAEGECGACTLILDGMAVMACLVPAPRAHGAEIITIEGLANEDRLHPVQEAFIEQDAVQCGYCTPGFIMSGAMLLRERPDFDLEAARQAITGNLCRCTGYYSILSAMQRAREIARED